MASSVRSSPRPEIPDPATQSHPEEEISSPHSLNSVTGGIHVESSRYTQSPDTIPIPRTPLPLLSTPLPDATTLLGSRADSIMPNRRPRKRRAKTQEVIPADSPSVVSLGMSPFMPGQDAIFNQNRLVQNEVILARHLSNLERSHSQSGSSHARSTEDIYRILTDHKKTIDKLTKAAENMTLRLDKEFRALSDSHMTTRKAVKAITRHLVGFSASTAASVSELNEEVRGLLPDIPVPTAADSSSQTLMQTLTSGSIHTRAGPESDLNARIFSNPEDRGTKRKRSMYPDLSNRSREVVYGPINDYFNSEEIVKEAVCEVGISPHKVQSVHATPGTPAFYSIQFLRNEDAQKFVDLVGMGLNRHPLRRAYFADGSSMGGASDVASGSTSMAKPWLL